MLLLINNQLMCCALYKKPSHCSGGFPEMLVPIVKTFSWKTLSLGWFFCIVFKYISNAQFVAWAVHNWCEAKFPRITAVSKTWCDIFLPDSRLSDPQNFLQNLSFLQHNQGIHIVAYPFWNRWPNVLPNLLHGKFQHEMLHAF